MAKVLFNIAFTSKNPPTNLPPKKKADYIARRAFYDTSADYNYFGYSLDNRKTVKNKDILRYMQQNDEENCGAFNLQRPLSKEELEQISGKLKKTDSIIWHGVISFDEEASKGFNSQERAIKFLNQSFNAFLERTHLNKNNLELIASLHKDTDNRHIHFCFFEKEPKRRDSKGNLTYTKKGAFKDTVIENYLVSANMHMSDNSYEYYTARERAMAKLKELRANFSTNKLGNAELKQRLKALASILPKKGRLQYNADNMASFRKEIDEVALLLIKSDEGAYIADKQFRAALAKKELEAQNICTIPVAKTLQYVDEPDKQLKYVNNRELNSREIQQLIKEGKTEYIRANNINWENIDYFERLRQDYKARIGNQVLGLIKEMNRDFSQKTRAQYNDKQQKIQARLRRRRENKALFDYMKFLGGYQRGLQADFTRRLHEIENEQAERTENA